MKLPRLLLADDHRIVLEGLTRLLEKDFEVVGAVTDGQALVAAAKELRPDVIVADISMPKLNGLKAAASILEVDASMKVIMLTMYDDIEYAVEAFEMGVMGYVLKDSLTDELILAIRSVLNGETYVTPSVAKAMVKVFSRGDKKPPSGIPVLSSRQRELLRLIATGLSAKEIGKQLGISRRTVEDHKYRLMEKIGVDSTAELIRYAAKYDPISE